MSLPYFPLYVTDFEGDTSHLTMAEDGAYNRLLRLCWRTNGCSIPNDNQWIMRRVRATQEEYESVVKPVIEEYFKVKNQRVYSPRLLSEFVKTQAKANAARENGKKGGRPAKLVKINIKDKPKAFESKTQQKATHTHTHTHIIKTIQKDFDLFWDIYPSKKDKKKANDKFTRLIKSGEDSSKIISGAKKYISFKTVREGFIKNPTTWLNGECWNDIEDSKPMNGSASKADMYRNMR